MTVSVKVGDKFHFWEVVSLEKKAKSGKLRTYAKVKCVCGSESLVEPSRLKTERTTACKSCALKGKSKKHRRLENGEAIINDCYGNYKRNAARKNYEFSLTKEIFAELILSDCFYCGKAPSTLKKTEWDCLWINGIDRVNNNLGYTVDNCVPACSVCNYMKKSTNCDEFINQCKNIYFYSLGKN